MKVIAFGRDVAVVEAEERHAELGEELEGHVGLVLGLGHGVAAVGQPRPVERALAEHVAPGPAEGVPVADGEAEVVLHAAAEHDPVAVVVAEGQVGGGVGPLVADGLDVAEEGIAHGCSWQRPPESSNLPRRTHPSPRSP